MLIILLERGIPLFFKIQNSLWAILVCVLFYELGQYNLLKQITQANICTNTTANYMILIKILRIFFRVLKHPVNKDQLSLCRKQSSPYHIFYRLSTFDIPYYFSRTKVRACYVVRYLIRYWTTKHALTFIRLIFQISQQLMVTQNLRISSGHIKTIKPAFILLDTTS